VLYNGVAPRREYRLAVVGCRATDLGGFVDEAAVELHAVAGGFRGDVAEPDMYSPSGAPRTLSAISSGVPLAVLATVVIVSTCSSIRWFVVW
jgi:hypothetical protein